MNNHQCYCYGAIALNNILKAKLPITSDLFFNELHYLWDLYSEEEIQNEYFRIVEAGKLVI